MKRLSLGLTIAGLALLVIALLLPDGAYITDEDRLLFGSIAGTYLIVGGMVADRRGEHPIGWLILGIGFSMGAWVLVSAYADRALAPASSLPLGRETAWLSTLASPIFLCGMTLLVLLFPEGRTKGAFRTGAARAVVVVWSLVSLMLALKPGPMDGYGPVENPFGVPALPALLVDAMLGLALAAFVATVASVILRLRRASGAERQQIKLFCFAAAMVPLAQVVNIPLFGLDTSPVGLLAVVASFVALPTAIGLAVMRYGLYDIDLVIKRTLVYGALTLLLVSVYLGLVLGLRSLLNPLTGESDLAVAASTLAVAALFRPLRSRIQSLVDRRFYRARYDASKAVGAFAAQLRQEVDLDAVTTDLLGVVHDTLQPEHATLWLRGASQGGR